jgi:transcriptional regulator NrdR
VRCPFCANLDDKVVDSREGRAGDLIRRRRECLKCGRRFTTYERIDEIPYMVVKKDGRRERFDRQKILQGLLKSCEKRPVATPKLEALVDEVERFVLEAPNRERTTTEIGELLMLRLEKTRQGGLRPLRLGLPRLQGRQRIHGRAEGFAERPD